MSSSDPGAAARASSRRSAGPTPPRPRCSPGGGPGRRAARLAPWAGGRFSCRSPSSSRGAGRPSGHQIGAPPPAPAMLTGWRAWAASGAAGAVVGGAFLLPVAQLLVWSVTAFRASDFDNRYPEFALNTLTIGATTAMVAVGAAVVVAYGLRLSRSRVVAACGRIATMGYALPGSVIAVGVLVPLAFLDRVCNALVRVEE